MKCRALLTVCVYAGVALATGYLGQAQVRDPAPVTDAMLQDPDPADWSSWRRTLDGWGYSPLDEIDRSNVDELRLAWSWGLEPGVSQHLDHRASRRERRRYLGRPAAPVSRSTSAIRTSWTSTRGPVR